MGNGLPRGGNQLDLFHQPDMETPASRTHAAAVAAVDRVIREGTLGVEESPLRFIATFFPDRAAKTKSEQQVTLEAMAKLIRTTRAPIKDDLPWWKLAIFGSLPNPKTDSGSLRWNGNVKWLSGVLGDYDGGQITPDEAAEKLDKAGIIGLIYTSPSHTDATSRWRVVCPFSKTLPPDEHYHMVARVNGVLGGVLAPESFTLSQAYYFGSINGSPAPRVIILDGTATLECCGELDEVAIGKPNGNGRAEHKPGDPEAAIEDIKAALAVIPNPIPSWDRKNGTWVQWNNVGMAVWRALGGSDAGFRLFDAWSQKWVAKYDADETAFRWNHFHRSPPNQIGFGTLVHIAREVVTGWTPRAEGRSATPLIPLMFQRISGVHPIWACCGCIGARRLRYR